MTEENISYFNLHKSKCTVPGWDQTHDPRISAIDIRLAIDCGTGP